MEKDCGDVRQKFFAQLLFEHSNRQWHDELAHHVLAYQPTLVALHGAAAFRDIAWRFFDEQTRDRLMPTDFKFDEIGYWSELKLEIIRKYAAAYTKIVTANGLHPFYIDGFAGAGIHVSKKTGDYVPGSPLNALNTQPPFEKLFLVDLNTGKANHLRKIAAGYRTVEVFDGDCNSVLLEKVFPECRYDKFRRALCVLDPYGLHLSWKVMREAGRNGTIEFFLNFPVQDMNRNVIWKNPAAVSDEQKFRLTFFWGDDSWKRAAYKEEQDLFGSFQEKQSNDP